MSAMGRYFALVLVCFSITAGFAATWTSCGTGTWGTNSGNTTLQFTNGSGCTNPYSITFASGDIIRFAASQTITVAANVDLSSISNLTLEFYGAVNFDNGKIKISADSQIKLYPGSTLTCTGGCGNNDQITVGGTQYNGTDLDNINNSPRPTGVTSSGITPVKLLFFKAKNIDEKSVELVWATAEEKNFDYFSVERSTDGMEFSEIARVKGGGTSLVKRNYSYADTNPLVGRAYYRLVSVDFDLYTEAFNVISVNTKAGKNITIYPNPVVNGHFTVDLNFQTDSDLNALVTDLTGIEIAKFKISERSNALDLDLKPGTYLVKIYSGDFTSVSRFVVH